MKKVFTSLHTHTSFCDGKDDVEIMCCTAFEKGLAAIGFSAHCPMEKTGLDTSWHLKEAQTQEYINSVQAARKRWEGKLTVYLGLEVDYVKGIRSALDNDIQAMGLDYIIGSTHYVIPFHGALFTVDSGAEDMGKAVENGFDGDGNAMMNAYWDAVMEMITLGGFDIIGHVDLVKKNNRCSGQKRYRWFNEESEVYMRRAAEAIRAIAAAGLVVEVNTGGMNRGYISEPYPSPAILRLMRQSHVPVMISADAHQACHLDGNYEAACRIVREAGYAGHVVFAGRSNGKPVWREETLES